MGAINPKNYLNVLTFFQRIAFFPVFWLRVFLVRPYFFIVSQFWALHRATRAERSLSTTSRAGTPSTTKPPDWRTPGSTQTPTWLSCSWVTRGVLAFPQTKKLYCVLIFFLFGVFVGTLSPHTQPF